LFRVRQRILQKNAKQSWNSCWTITQLLPRKLIKLI